MENITIGIIASDEYDKELKRLIQENYLGVYTKSIKNNQIEEYLNFTDVDLLILEWREAIGNLITTDTKIIDKIKNKPIIFLVDKIPVEDNQVNKVLKEKTVLSKFDSIKTIIAEGKIMLYSQKTAKGFAEDLENTNVISAILFREEKKLIKKIRNIENTEKTLVISLKRWNEGEFSSNKNTLRRFFFYFIKEKDGISYSINEFIEEIDTSVYKFKFDKIENPIFFISVKELILMCDCIRKTKKFTQIIFDLGDCSYKGMKDILIYSNKVIINNTVQSGDLNLKAIESEILKGVNGERVYLE